MKWAAGKLLLQCWTQLDVVTEPDQANVSLLRRRLLRYEKTFKLELCWVYLAILRRSMMKKAYLSCIHWRNHMQRVQTKLCLACFWELSPTSLRNFYGNVSSAGHVRSGIQGNEGDISLLSFFSKSVSYSDKEGKVLVWYWYISQVYINHWRCGTRWERLHNDWRYVSPILLSIRPSGTKLSKRENERP